MIFTSMTHTEKRAVISLAAIMSLRMIGLFMVLPVFALYARGLPGATPTLIGLAMGCYGLSQAILQIPFGTLSDRFGRKPVIAFGLVIFVLGSIVCASAHTMTTLVIGRTLQGAGAVGSTLLALMADLTREEQRTKSMALAGMSIGLSFAIAMVMGPVLSDWMPINQLFWVAVVFGLLAIVLLYTKVPTPTISRWHRDTEPELHGVQKLLIAPELAKLNLGILFLHAIFTASFIVIPISLQQFAHIPVNHQWSLYLPTLIIAFILSLMCMGMAERKKRFKPFFIGGISTLIAAQLCWWFAPGNTSMAALGLCFFFGGFSLLEAFLPSMISRLAPADRKGSALGIYSCAQFFGIFTGGALGGWLYGQFSFAGVYLFCISLALLWLILAFFMQTPRYLVTQLWRLTPAEWDAIVKQLHLLPGVIEMTFVPSDGVAYLKMEPSTIKDPTFISIKAQLNASTSARA